MAVTLAGRAQQPLLRAFRVDLAAFAVEQEQGEVDLGLGVARFGGAPVPVAGTRGVGDDPPALGIGEAEVELCSRVTGGGGFPQLGDGTAVVAVAECSDGRGAVRGGDGRHPHHCDQRQAGDRGPLSQASDHVLQCPSASAHRETHVYATLYRHRFVHRN